MVVAWVVGVAATCAGAGRVRQCGRWLGGGKVGLLGMWMWYAWRQGLGVDVGAGPWDRQS
jgi:hypothetical protein